jgi:hypothetical protein
MIATSALSMPFWLRISGGWSKGPSDSGGTKMLVSDGAAARPVAPAMPPLTPPPAAANNARTIAAARVPLAIFEPLSLPDGTTGADSTDLNTVSV